MKQKNLTRGEFVKVSAAGVGGAALFRKTLLAGRGASLVDDGAPDTIFFNGKVVTMDAADSTAQAIALKGGLVKQTGTDAVIRALAGPLTTLIDLKGRTLTPALIDSHIHFQAVGLMNEYYTMFIPPEVTTIAQLQAALAEFLKTLPAGEWVNGVFNMGTFPTRKDLDPVSPNHPVWLTHQPGHIGSANSKALQIAGITASTPNPTGGLIEKDASGEPTGLFYNHRAMDLVRRNIPPVPRTVQRDSIVSMQRMYAGWGVSAYHDTNVRGADSIQTYLDLAKEHALYLRGALYYTLEWPQDLQTALALERYSDPYMRLAGFKFLIDGQVPTAYCFEPTNGVSWNMPTWDPTMFKQYVKTLHDTGLQVSVHCVGDASVGLVLDAYEEAMNANPRSDPRHRIEHAVLTKPDQTKRIKDLGVVISTQPQFIRYGGDTYESILGADRMNRIMVTREWLTAGVPMALSSDGPTAPWLAPTATLSASMARLTFSGKQIGPDQVLTAKEALRAHTITAAYMAHEEKLRGSLEPGKEADLIVWTNDPTTATPNQMYNATIDLAMVGGKVIFPLGSVGNWVLPSSARASGSGGAFYTTDVTVANTGTADAGFTLKFLGNNADGRGGVEKSFALGAGKSVTYTDVLSSVFGLASGWGAILIKADSASLAIVGQTSTPGGGGTFGQTVPACGAADLIVDGSPRSIPGIREDGSFRTNLMMANVNETSVDVDVSLIAEGGTTIGAKRYSLPPLGMTQVSRVARELGATGNVTGARLLLSTPTASGAFAAYASIIDNVTNDPRTLLPM